jgi:hypothetical protein
MSKWVVISHEYDEVEPVLDCGAGPIVNGRAEWRGEADNAKEALACAIRSPEFRHVVSDARADGRSPFGTSHAFRLPPCEFEHETDAEADACIGCRDHNAAADRVLPRLDARASRTYPCRAES